MIRDRVKMPKDIFHLEKIFEYKPLEERYTLKPNTMDESLDKYLYVEQETYYVVFYYNRFLDRVTNKRDYVLESNEHEILDRVHFRKISLN